MMSLLVCETCGPVHSTHIEEREETLVVRGEAVTAHSPVRICDTCGEEMFDEDLETATLDRFYAAYREKHNLVGPAEIAALRARYGLSQRSLSALLGLGAVTVHRYEAGALPDEAHNLLLQLLQDPANMQAVFDQRQEALSPAARRKLSARLEKLTSPNCDLHEEEQRLVVWTAPDGPYAIRLDIGFTTRTHPDILRWVEHRLDCLRRILMLSDEDLVKVSESLIQVEEFYRDREAVPTSQKTTVPI